MRSITKKQANYIDILSSYDSTKVEDKQDILNFLGGLGKDDIYQLSIREASDLIQLLLQRPTEYTFLCGKKAELHKQEVNSFNVLGEIEACIHGCPDENIQGDVNGCQEWAQARNL